MVYSIRPVPYERPTTTKSDITKPTINKCDTDYVWVYPGMFEPTFLANAIQALSLVDARFPQPRPVYRNINALGDHDRTVTTEYNTAYSSNGKDQKNENIAYSVNGVIFKASVVPIVVAFYYIQNQSVQIITKVVCMLLLLTHFVLIGVFPLISISNRQSTTAKTNTESDHPNNNYY